MTVSKEITEKVRRYEQIPEGLQVCPRCGSGEYLRNEDGAPNRFCGQCGQAIKWPSPQK